MLFALPGILTPATPIALSGAQFSLGPIPGSVFYWAWVAVRLGTLLSVRTGRDVAWRLVVVEPTGPVQRPVPTSG